MDIQWIDLAQKRQALAAEAEANNQIYAVKTYSGDQVGLEEDKGDFVATISTDSPDEDGEVVQPRNIDLTRFNKVQGIHIDHDIQSLPVGRAKWIKATDHSLISKYFISKATEETRAVDFMLREGILHMHSVSFMGDKAVTPDANDLRSNPHWKGYKVYKGRPLLIEFSIVGQPANANCDMISVGKKFGQQVVDRLVGKTANTEKAAKDIQEMIEQQPTIVKNDPAELRKRIAKALDSIAINIDHDALIKRLRI